MSVVTVLLITITFFMQSLPAANATYSSMNPIQPTLPPTGTQIQIPGAPIGLTAKVTSSSEIDLSWSPSSNGGAQITGYMIERESGNGFVVLVQNTGSTLTSYRDTGLDSARTYSYRVSAINSAGTGSPSNSITETTFPATTTQLNPQPLPPLTLPPQSSAGSSTPKLAKIEYVIKIDGIQGESQIPGEAGAIDIVGWSWGAVNPNSASFQSDLNQAVTWIRPGAEDISFTKVVDKASPKLMLACANGEHIANIEMDGLADLGQGPRIFLKITLHDVLVSSYQVSGSNSERPMESISLNFAKIDQPAWDQTVLQNAANQRMAMLAVVKYEDLAKTALTAPTANPSIDVYGYGYQLSLNGGQGTLQSLGQHAAIKLSSFQWGVTNNNAKISMQDLNFVMLPSETVSLNFGKIKLSGATLYCVQYRETDLVSFSFGSPTIISSQTGNNEIVSSESVSLNFTSIEMVHPSSGIKAGWDLKSNRAISEITPTKTYQIPTWVHNNAKMWAKGMIGDNDFEQGMQYLINQGLIQLPPSQAGAEQTAPSGLPTWIKHNADWWSQGQISDDDFVKGLQYLVGHGIIKVNKLAMQVESWEKK